MTENTRIWPFALSGILGGLAVLGGQALMPSSNTQRIEVQATDYSSPAPKTLSESKLRLTGGGGDDYPNSFVEAAEKTMPAVVNVSAIKEAQARSRQEQRSFDFFGSPRPSEATGSGVIISQKGYIVTNNHVIKGASRVEVTLYDKRKYTAKVVGTDPSTDLAVLKIEETKDLTVLPMADSDLARVGEWVLAVGNPFELTSTVTAGIVSAKGRNINILNSRQSIESFIQTDAAVNPGNSGGALVNTKGELLGINTAIATPTGTYAGYSFAVPTNLVRKVVQDLIDYGEVRRGFLGIMIQEVNDELAKTHSLNVTEGVYINEVLAEGGAAEAGITVGDVVVKVNGVNIRSVAELQEKVGSRNPGESITLTIFRKGSPQDVAVKLK